MRSRAPVRLRFSLKRSVSPILLCLLGLAMAYHPMALSGFAKVPGDLGDARFINYVLEHSYRWLIGAPRHSFWSPPVLYPEPNTAAYSDILLGVAPCYWIWRIVGFDPSTAFQLWILTCSCLNFAAFYVLLRRCFALGSLASSTGAFLFSFGNSRINQLNHLQLNPQFFTIVAFYALSRIFARDGRPSPPHWTRAWIAVFFASLVAQLYAGFYFGWFLGFSLAVATAWAVARSDERRALLALPRRYPIAIAASAAFAILALIPWAVHSLRAAATLPSYTFASVEGWLPRWQSWLYLGPHNWLYGWTAARWPFRAIPPGESGEHVLGLGLVTTVAGALGLAAQARRPVIRLQLLVAGTLVLLSTAGVGRIAVWRIVFILVPGASAVRTVARIGLLLLIPISLGVALTIERARQAHRTWLALAIAALVIVEQGNTFVWWDKDRAHAEVRAIASAVEPDCGAFLYTPVGDLPPWPADGWYRYQIDAMWAGLETGVPTVNGYPPNPPSGWGFIDPVIRSAADEARLAAALDRWQARRPIAGRVCWIRQPPP